VLLHRGRLARVEGRTDVAARHYTEARRAAGRLAPDPVTAEWLEGVGATLAAGEDVDAAAELLGAADALRAAIGAPVPPHERPAHDRDLAGVRAALGDAAFAQAWEAGQSLGLPHAVELAGVRLMDTNRAN
jgi:hypothetical protein